MLVDNHNSKLLYCHFSYTVDTVQKYYDIIIRLVQIILQTVS